MKTSRILSVLGCAALLWGCGGGSGIGNQPVCGNGQAETDELCDGLDLAGETCETLNLGGGELSCDGLCAFDVSACELEAECGNGLIEYPEDCDIPNLGGETCEGLGYDAGPLNCTAACSFDESACEIVAECGDGVQEPGEECDGDDLGGATCANLGLEGGTLACDGSCYFLTADCDLQSECGNDHVEYPEVCDGADLDNNECTDQGFYSGTLACNADCEGFDTTDCAETCGDAIINGPEVCDGAEVSGETCANLGQYPGALMCLPDCSDYDVSTCGGECGDGVMNGPEGCDMTDFGGDSCQDRGFYTGSLTCAANCADIDDSACADYCGDGTVNGTEQCDGADLGGLGCSNGAPPRCLPDCTDVVCNFTTVLVVEVGHGNPDWVELLNVSGGAIDLLGWTLEWYGYDNNQAAVGGVLTLPAYSLAAGARVVVLDEYGGDGSPPDVDTTAGDIQFHDNIWWGGTPGAVLLSDDQSAPVDFVRWSGNDFDPPAGMPWSDAPELPGSSNDDWLSISRNPENLDTDTAGDWCLTPESMYVTNEPCPVVPEGVLITEIDTGQPIDRIELYNGMNTDVDLDGWYLAGGGGFTWLPPYTLASGSYVAIIDDCTNNCPTVDTVGIHVQNINWASDDAGSCSLLEPVIYAGVDHVRWGGSQTGATPPDSWDDSMGQLPAMPNTVVIGRHTLTDTDTSADWCVMATDSFGSANGACQ